MPSPRQSTLTRTAASAPTTSRELPDDWKLLAACHTFDGPVTQIPISLCAVCPVREPCAELYETVQAELTEARTSHTANPQVGMVWGGKDHTKSKLPVGVEYGSLQIKPCGDECSTVRFAKGACRNHYNQQYNRIRKAGVEPTVAKGCKEKDCDSEHAARGMCAHHYHKWRVAQKALGNRPERPAAKRSSKPLDEPSYAGYQRATRAGELPTEAQYAARAAYQQERWKGSA